MLMFIIYIISLFLFYIVFFFLFLPFLLATDRYLLIVVRVVIHWHELILLDSVSTLNFADADARAWIFVLFIIVSLYFFSSGFHVSLVVLSSTSFSLKSHIYKDFID